MTKLIDILMRAKAFQEDANQILSYHDSSPAQTIRLDKTLENLDALSISQAGLLNEAILCVRTPGEKLFRAAHVLAWAAMMDYLEAWIAKDGFVKLSEAKGQIAAKKEKNRITRSKKLTSEEKRKSIEEAVMRAKKRWKFDSVEELRDSTTDKEIIASMKEAKYFGKTEMKSLHGLLSQRNECAHPSEHDPNLTETIGYIGGMLNRIARYERAK